MSFRHPFCAARLAALCLIAPLVLLAASHAARAVPGYVLREVTASQTGDGVLYDNGTIVGIATTSPQSLLHVYGGEVQVGSSNASCAVANAGAIRYSGGTLYYCDNASTWEALDSSGQVDVGDYYTATQTATPTSGQGMFGGSSTLGGVLAGFGSTADVTLENRSNTPALEIRANSTNIYMPGFVGIGTTAPLSSLSVAGNLALGAYGGGASTTAAPSNGLIVSGNVGIGTTSPSTALQVNGTAAVNILTITTPGNIGFELLEVQTAAPLFLCRLSIR